MTNNENHGEAVDSRTPLVSIKMSRNRRPWKIVSGGQTGVDRAGLAAAMSFSIQTGGWAPMGRIAEDGVVPEGLAEFAAEVEKLGGVDEAMRQLEEFNRKWDAMTPEERWGVTRVEFPDVGDPVPPDVIPKLLASDPARGLFELERATFSPDAGASGAVRKVLSEAFDDSRISSETKAELLWRYNHVDLFRKAALSGWRGSLPLCLLDSDEGRKWYCARKMADYETVRCSSPVFFKRIAEISSFDWEKGKVKIEEIVKKAIDDDAPAQLRIALDLSGRTMDARILYYVLLFRKAKILDWLLKNDDKTKEFLDERRALFYVCANWPFGDLSAYVENAEKANPGIVASCTDALGRNLLWYLIYNNCICGKWVKEGTLKEAENLLLRLGADPDAMTKWGVSWRQWRDARESFSWCYDISFNGEKSGLFGVQVPPQGDGDAHHVRIALRGTGLAMEWAFPKTLFPVAEKAFIHVTEIRPSLNDDNEVVATFRDSGEGVQLRAIFRRGHDRLFHFEKVERKGA